MAYRDIKKRRATRSKRNKRPHVKQVKREYQRTPAYRQLRRNYQKTPARKQYHRDFMRLYRERQKLENAN